MNAFDKARLFPEPDPLAVILARIARLTMLPHADSTTQLELRFPQPPTSRTWADVAETAVPTLYPGRRSAR